MNISPITVATLMMAVRLGHGDLYMHNPRGSNNRLNEGSAARTNANRAFDSQNNNRGGYNVGDLKSTASGSTQANQYRMKYFQSGTYLNEKAPNGRSELVLEWTNQHGCGGNEDHDPHRQNCNIVIQALCQAENEAYAPDDGITLRDGIQVNTQGYYQIHEDSTPAQFTSRKNADVTSHRVLQEPWYWYEACKRRDRNKGLFTATQNLANNDATSTRQNPNGARFGFECPEERDYFPYFHPTPFFDIAVLAQNESMCSYYTDHSANRAVKYQCVQTFANSMQVKHFSKHNNKADCEADGGAWKGFYSMLELASCYNTQALCESDHFDGMSYKWGLPYDPQKIDTFEPIEEVCFVQPPPIDCQAASWTRSNHLGNGREGVPLNYTWTIPYFPSHKDQRCILRIRYNISTDDYDPYNTDASSNGHESPVQQNPLVDVGAKAQALRLAINTAQTGRTFQDRSHTFILKARPHDFDSKARILNLNVRGKRGNIVQTFPAVEYDFVPNRMTVRKGKDLVHIQWTGSNTHTNGNPAGDGEAGNDGEGTAGTDRHNFLQSSKPGANYPLPVEAMTMFKNATVEWSSMTSNIALTPSNLELFLASSGYYECFERTDCSKAVDYLALLQDQLNNAPASFEGVVVKFNEAGTHYYICTRNNNFTNRSQKGHLIVK